MNTLRLITAGLLVLMTVAAVPAGEKKPDTNKEKVVGVWEVAKADEGGPPVGSVIEMTKDGKLKITVKQDGNEMKHEGTYIVEGEKINIVVKVGDNENKHSVTIKKLTATELVVENDASKTIEFKKKK